MARYIFNYPNNIIDDVDNWNRVYENYFNKQFQ